VLFRAKPSPEAIARYLDGSFEPRYRLAELTAAGLQVEASPPPPDTLGTLVALGAEYRVGLRNFYVITRYNRSALYAGAVNDLGEALAAQRSAPRPAP
jgi:membrane-bound lytic murein transglycosylase B